MNAEPKSGPIATENISTRQEFIHFLNNFLVDYQQNGVNWKSRTLGEFLEALASYAEDIQGYYFNLSRGFGSSVPVSKEIDADAASWRVFADMLRGATMYE